MLDVAILHCGGDKEIEFIEYLSQTMRIQKCPFEVEYRTYRPKHRGIDTIMRMDAEKYKQKNDGVILLVSKAFFDVMWPSVHKTTFLKLISTTKMCIQVWLDVTEQDVIRRSTVLSRSIHKINVEDAIGKLSPEQIYRLLLEVNSSKTKFLALNNLDSDWSTTKIARELDPPQRLRIYK